MNILNTIILQASGGGGGLGGMVMILAMVAIFYFFMIRPQSKKQKEIKKAREAMRKGDKVVTAGGIHGTIRAIMDDTITLEISKGVDIRVDKASVYPASAETSAKSAKPRKEEEPKEIEQKEEVAAEENEKN